MKVNSDEMEYSNENIDKFKIHLLTLSDYFNETKKFQLAVTDLPPLRDFRQ